MWSEERSRLAAHGLNTAVCNEIPIKDNWKNKLKQAEFRLK